MSKANKLVLGKILELKEKHPAWGYRRVHAYLKYRQGFKINHKRVYRLMKLNNLLVPKNRRLRAKRAIKTSKPRTVIPNRIWGTDMTKTKIDHFGWAYLHIVLDWGSKKIVGWQLNHQSKTKDWLEAVHKAINQQFPDGYRQREKPLMLVCDNGCQPTSHAFKKQCKEMGLKQIFTSFCNPKGNADTERVIITIKEDLIWINEWESFEHLKEAIEDWVKDYNLDFPHSSLNQMTPYEYEKNFNDYYAI